MLSSVFITFDTETTGLYPGFDALVEIAACRFLNGKAVDSFQTLINPERDIPDEVVKIHGITNEMVKDAPNSGEAIGKFFEFIKDDPIFAHNAPFDERFISFACHKFQIKPPANPIYDTLQLTRRLFPELQSHGLAALTTVFDIPHEVKHRGMPDVMGTRGVLEKCIERLAGQGIKSWKHFMAWYGDPLTFLPDKYGLLVTLPIEYKALKNAIEKGGKLEIIYEDRTSKRTKRIVEPMGLFVAYGNLYLSAYCHLRG
ncbi:MAG TPA: WYL domain-containing protein, partial [Firmicutes bacterium]|nr:WYL domain-containing protein [Bacillota bacterium]